MDNAQAGLVGAVMMVAGAAIVLGIGAFGLAGFLLYEEQLATTAGSPSPAAEVSTDGPAGDPSSDGGAEGKLSLGVVAGEASDAAAGAGDTVEKDEESPEPSEEPESAGASEPAPEVKTEPEPEVKPEPEPVEPPPPRPSPKPATTTVKPKPRPPAPAPTSAGASVRFTGKRPLVYTFTGADGRVQSGSRARLSAGTYSFAAAVSGLEPRKQADVTVPSGASSITIHCDEASMTCTQK